MAKMSREEAIRKATASRVVRYSMADNTLWIPNTGCIGIRTWGAIDCLSKYHNVRIRHQQY